jgi:DNA-binding CsgD family transcriptional regulator
MQLRLEQLVTEVKAGLISGESGLLLDVVIYGVRCIFIDTNSFARLSPREKEVACLVARGETNRAIAGTLGISQWTVSIYLRRIFAKSGVGCRAEMVAKLFSALG